MSERPRIIIYDLLDDRGGDGSPGFYDAFHRALQVLLRKLGTENTTGRLQAFGPAGRNSLTADVMLFTQIVNPGLTQHRDPETWLHHMNTEIAGHYKQRHRPMTGQFRVEFTRAGSDQPVAGPLTFDNIHFMAPPEGQEVGPDDAEGTGSKNDEDGENIENIFDDLPDALDDGDDVNTDDDDADDGAEEAPPQSRRFRRPAGMHARPRRPTTAELMVADLPAEYKENWEALPTTAARSSSTSSIADVWAGTSVLEMAKLQQGYGERNSRFQEQLLSGLFGLLGQELKAGRAREDRLLDIVLSNGGVAPTPAVEKDDGFKGALAKMAMQGLTSMMGAKPGAGHGNKRPRPATPANTAGAPAEGTGVDWSEYADPTPQLERPQGIQRILDGDPAPGAITRPAAPMPLQAGPSAAAAGVPARRPTPRELVETMSRAELAELARATIHKIKPEMAGAAEPFINTLLGGDEGMDEDGNEDPDDGEDYDLP